MAGENFYVKIRRERGKTFLFVYDVEAVDTEDGPFDRESMDRTCDSGEFSELCRSSESINFFGERAVAKAIDEGFVSPDAVGAVGEVSTAMHIRG